MRKKIKDTLITNRFILIAVLVLAVATAVAVNRDNKKREDTINGWVENEIKYKYATYYTVEYDYVGTSHQDGDDYSVYDVQVLYGMYEPFQVDNYMIFVYTPGWKKESTVKWFQYEGTMKTFVIGG